MTKKHGKPGRRGDGPSSDRQIREAQETTGSEARRIAVDAMIRIDQDNAYANLVLPPMLAKANLSDRDRGFVTELVYGTTRMMRACDFLVNRFVLDKIEPEVRAALRLGAYQLHYLGTPRHAAVGATVGAIRGRGRSVVNAVLRRVADAEDAGPVVWPNLATELSYPNWIVKTLTEELGEEAAVAALRVMNQAAVVHERDDGYVQDLASQRVVEAVGAQAGEVVIDLCAAPGGKSTGIAASGAMVIAGDLQPHRVELIAQNASRLDAPVFPLVADGMHPPLRPGSADRVLIDAPCSGLGSLRRRADARWRIDAAAPERLQPLQVSMALAGFELLKPGGQLTYSVCTLTAAEGVDVRAQLIEELGDRAEVGPLDLALPTEDSDGMILFQITRVG